MGEQRQQPTDERPEATGEVTDAELERAAGGFVIQYGKASPNLWRSTHGGSLDAVMAEWSRTDLS